MYNPYRDSFSQPNMPKSEQKQPTNSFFNAMGILNPASRNWSNNSTPNHAKKYRFDQNQLASHQVPPFVNSPVSMQQPNQKSFPNIFATPQNFRNNASAPSFNASLSLTPVQQLPKFNGPTAKIEKAMIDGLKRELKKLESLHCPELTQAYQLVFKQLKQLENGLNPDWLDFNQWKEITLLEYVLVPLRNDVNISACLFGVNGDTLKQIRMKYCCEIDLCGAGSSFNRAEELHLLYTGNPLHQHFAWPLHLKICVKAPAFLAYERLWKVMNLADRIFDMKEPFEWDGIRINGYFPSQDNCADQASQKHQ